MERRFALGLCLGLFAATGGTAQTAPPVSAPADDEEVVVVGRAQRLYRVDTTTVGRVAEDPLNIPQAVQVINSDLFRDQGARDVTDIYRNISGVSLFSYAGVTFRGFRQDQSFYDGLRGNPFIGFSVPQLFNIERVEVLKGPAGLFFGPGAPGGIINYVTQRPSEEASLRMVATAGNFDRVGLSAEATDRIDRDGVLSYRIGGFYESMDPFRVNTQNKALIGDAGLTIRTGEVGRLTLQATTYDNQLQGNRLRGVPVSDDGRFLTSIRWNHNEPTDFLELRADALQARYEGRIGSAVRFDAGVRRFTADEAQQYHEPRGLTTVAGDLRMTREFRDQIRDADGLSIGANVVADVRLLGMAHRLQVGGEWYEEDSLLRSRILRAGVTSLSLANPVYVRNRRDVDAAARLPFTDTLTETDRRGAYFQDQVSLGDTVILVGGLRYDSFRDRAETSMNGVVSRDVTFRDDRVTWRGGAVWKPRQDISVYASWSESFEPQGAASQNPAAGGPFDPVTGDQWEGGVKSALLGGRLQANAAVYRIVRQNILQVDPTLPPVAGVDQLRPIGEVTSEGFEFDLATDITPDWVALVNYGHNNARITATVPGQAILNAVGARFANAPRDQIGFWTRYQLRATRTAIAFGGEHVSRRISLNGQTVRPYTVFDASLTQDLGRFQLLLRVDNIFDRTYAASGFSLASGHFPGEPRTVLAELRAGF